MVLAFSGRRPLSLLLLCVALALGSSARGELAIEITQGVDAPVPVAVVPFAWQGRGRPPEDLGKIIRFDLARSGQFAMTAPEDMLSLPSRPEELYVRDWRVQGIAYVLLGSVRPTESGLEARYALYDVFAERLLFDETREARAGPRALAIAL